MKKLYSKPFFIALSVIVSIALFLVIDFMQRKNAVYKTLDVEFKIAEIEYGSNIKAEDLVSSHIGELSVEEPLNTYQLGHQTLNYMVSKKEERYKTDVRRHFEITVDVEDTNEPIIDIQEDTVYIYKGNNYDPQDNIVRVYDIVDGDIKDYDVETSLNSDESGEYEVIIKAKDKNDLMSQKTYKIIVRNKIVSSSEGYGIIYNSLTSDYGYNKAAACGILANIRFESNFVSDIGDYYYGLCQWGGSRKNNLYSFCQNNGLDAASIEGQLAYLDYELSNSYPSVKSYLLNIENSSSGAYNAAEYFCRNFEGAASAEGRGDLAISYFES